MNQSTDSERIKSLANGLYHQLFWREPTPLPNWRRRFRYSGISPMTERSATEWLKRQMRIIFVLCVWSFGGLIVLSAIVGRHLEHASQTLLIGIVIMAFSLGMANRMWDDLS